MKALGSEGEDFAVRFLRGKGYSILEKNFKTSIGEIDIIARNGDALVFIEVKTRTNDSFGYPFEAVTERKRHKLRNLALLYLKKKGREFPVRFDVISVYRNDGKTEIEHIEDAFEV